MSQIVHASLQFPTVVFSLALAIAIAYWLCVVLGALDVDHQHHLETEWSLLGFGGVPIAITLSMNALVGWIVCHAGMYAGAGLGGWFPAVLLPATVAISLPIAAALVRPIAPLFAISEGKSNADYIGHTCTVTTGHVDDGFGQATVEDGGTVLIIAVRCDRPALLARGDRALIIEFDPARSAYLVEPAAELAA